MKNNLTYYQHYADSHNHWKFKLLRSLLGWSAEGRFWALNNMIASSEECILKLHKKAVRACTINDLGLNEEEFEKFISVLTNDCELIINLDGNITTETVRDNLKTVLKERESARKRKLKSQSRLENENRQSKIFNI